METSEAFSGAPGDLLAFHYDSLDTQFDTLHQADDFEGGVVEAEFFEGVDPTSLVASLPSVTVENTGGTMWRFTWEDTVSPVQVLSELSTTRDFLGGSPVWVEEPPIWW